MKTLIKLQPLTKDALYSQISKILREQFEINYYPSQHIERKENTTVYTPLNIVFVHATEEEEKAYKMHLKINLRAIEEEKKRKYDHIKTPLIDLYNPKKWRKGLKILARNFQNVVEITEEAHDHFMNCVPHKIFESSSFITGEAYDTTPQGENVYLCCVKKGLQYFAQYGTVKQYRKRELFKSNPVR